MPNTRKLGVWIAFIISTAVPAGALASTADPCANATPNELNPKTCPRFYERKSGPSGSCCVLQGLSREELEDALRPEARNETLSHVTAILNSVVVNNSAPPAALRGGKLAVTEFNIERGESWGQLSEIFSDCERYVRHYLSYAPANVREDACRLQKSDILLLIETDDGVCRTGFRDVPAELASITGMNYAFAPEFVEISADRAPVCPTATPDRSHYRHGETILSRFPIRRARRIELAKCYDWFGSELQWPLWKEAIPGMEPQVRRGDRIALVADIELPAPLGPITVVAAHLENRTSASCRTQQIQQILDALKGVRNPILLGGDLNTLGYNPEDRNPLNFITPETAIATFNAAGFDTSMNDGRYTMAGIIQGAATGRLDHLALQARGCYRPSGGKTLDSLWYYGADLSDHHPITADLVFGDAAGCRWNSAPKHKVLEGIQIGEIK